MAFGEDMKTRIICTVWYDTVCLYDMYIFMYTYIYIIVNRFIQIHYSAFFLSLGSVREDRSFIVFDVYPATLILRKGAATQNFSMEVHHFESTDPAVGPAFFRRWIAERHRLPGRAI